MRCGLCPQRAHVQKERLDTHSDKVLYKGYDGAIDPVTLEAMFQLGLEARVELHRAGPSIGQETGRGISGSVGNALHPWAKKKVHDHLGSPATPVSASGFLCQDPGAHAGYPSSL